MVFLGPVAQNLINGMAAKKSPLKFDFVEGKSTLPEFGFKDKDPYSNGGIGPLSVKEEDWYQNKYWVPSFLGDEWISERDEYRSEWRRFLVDKNVEQITNSTVLERRAIRFTFYKKSIIRSVFGVCKMLKQPPEVRYLALDILDRFLMVHFFQVLDEVLLITAAEPDTNRVLSQLPLRVLSAVQLATKYCCSSKAISVTTIKKLLERFGLEYAKHSIVKSETRLYRTLNYNIPMVTPLTYVEMFIEDLQEQLIDFDIPMFLIICVDVLDVAVAHHNEIYKKLLRKITGRKCQSLRDKRQYVFIEGDYMYLAIAVTIVAAIIEDPSEKAARRIAKFLSHATEYNKAEIEDLARLILEIIRQD